MQRKGVRKKRMESSRHTHRRTEINCEGKTAARASLSPRVRSKPFGDKSESKLVAVGAHQLSTRQYPGPCRRAGAGVGVFAWF